MNRVTLDALIEVFEEFVDLSRIDVDEDAVLGEDVPVDSKEMLRILSRIESLYRFRFEPREVLTIRTVGDLLGAIRRR